MAKENDLKVIEDGAQGFGGSINGKMACSFGDISTTSFFPAKPLGCYGDGGAIFTDDEELYNKILSIRVHGKGSFKYENVRVGLNSRLDTIQAAILLPKLRAFEEYELSDRNKVAKLYTEKLSDLVVTPLVYEGYKSSWAQYTIILNSSEERSFVQNKLKEKGIPSMIYYPIPLHKQKVYDGYNFNLEELRVTEKLCNVVLSIPMHPYLRDDEIDMVVNTLRDAIIEYRK